MTKAKLAPSSVWGLDAGDRSLTPRDGTLVVGGYDTSRFVGNLTTFPLGNWTQQPCPLQVVVTDVWYLAPDSPTRDSLFEGNSNSMVACVEPFQQRFTFLPSMVERFALWTRYNDSYPSLTFPVDSSPPGALEIRLDNGYVTTIPNDHLFTPKRGSDENGHYVVTNSSIVETGIEYNVDKTDAGVRPILGGLFLTFNYLVVDYDSDQFHMASMVQRTPGSSASITASCTPSPTTAGSNTNSSQTITSHANGSSRAAAIGGGTAGAVAGFAAIAVLCYCLVRKRRQVRQRPEQKQTEEIFDPVTMGPRSPSVVQTPSELALVR